MADPLAREAPPVSADRQDYFDRYWIQRDFVRTDRRTMERAQLVWQHLHRRRGRALDVGCGRGLFAAFLAEQGLVVDALDISAQAVDLTRQRGIPAYQIDLEQQAPSGCFDLIFCLEVLQQVRDPERVLRRLAGVLDGDGELVMSVPNEFHMVRRLQVVAGRAQFGSLDDSHLRFFTPHRGADLLRRCGLEIRHCVHTSLVPPAVRSLAWLGRATARLWPSGLALSTIYFARRPRA